MSAAEKTYEGQCYCGAVKVSVTGDPAGAGYCHCKSCRSWSAGPVNAFTLWPEGRRRGDAGRGAGRGVQRERPELSPVGAAIGLGPTGSDAIAFFAILACCAWALVRTWRGEHTYG